MMSIAASFFTDTSLDFGILLKDLYKFLSLSLYINVKFLSIFNSFKEATACLVDGVEKSDALFTKT